MEVDKILSYPSNDGGATNLSTEQDDTTVPIIAEAETTTATAETDKTDLTVETETPAETTVKGFNPVVEPSQTDQPATIIPESDLHPDALNTQRARSSESSTTVTNRVTPTQSSDIMGVAKVDTPGSGSKPELLEGNLNTTLNKTVSSPGLHGLDATSATPASVFDEDSRVLSQRNKAKLLKEQKEKEDDYKEFLMKTFAILQQPEQTIFLQVATWRLRVTILIQPYIKFVTLLVKQLTKVKLGQNNLVKNYKKQMIELSVAAYANQNISEPCILTARGCRVGAQLIAAKNNTFSFQLCGKFCKDSLACEFWLFDYKNKYCAISKGPRSKLVVVTPPASDVLLCGIKEFRICKNVEYLDNINRLEAYKNANILEIEESGKLLLKLGLRLHSFIPELAEGVTLGSHITYPLNKRLWIRKDPGTH
jgi:hypothetical protein